MHKLKQPAPVICETVKRQFGLTAVVQCESIFGIRPSSGILMPVGTGTIDLNERRKRASRILFAPLKHGLMLFNPKTIINKVKEVRSACRNAESVKDSDIVGKPELVSAKIWIKLGAANGVSELIGPYVGAPLCGILLQELTRNAYWGVAGTIIGDYIPAVIAFQVTWLALNLRYYANSAKTAGGRIMAYLRDVIPLEIAAIIAGIPAYVIGGLLNVAIISGLNRISPHFAERIHILPLFTEMINGPIAQVVYLTLLGNQMISLTRNIIARYGAYLERRFGTPQSE